MDKAKSAIADKKQPTISSMFSKSSAQPSKHTFPDVLKDKDALSAKAGLDFSKDIKRKRTLKDLNSQS